MSHLPAVRPYWPSGAADVAQPRHADIGMAIETISDHDLLSVELLQRFDERAVVHDREKRFVDELRSVRRSR